MNPIRHGTTAGYRRGCREECCHAPVLAYKRAWRAKKRALSPLTDDGDCRACMFGGGEMCLRCAERFLDECARARRVLTDVYIVSSGDWRPRRS